MRREKLMMNFPVEDAYCRGRGYRGFKWILMDWEQCYWPPSAVASGQDNGNRDTEVFIPRTLLMRGAQDKQIGPLCLTLPSQRCE